MRHALIALALLAGCTPAPAPVASVPGCPGLPGMAGITAQLFFGRSIKGGGTVTDAAWRAFLAENVTPRFPAGFTVLDGYGQWQQRSTGRIIREASNIIEIAGNKTPDTIWNLEAIRADYRGKFDQESVGLVISESCVSF